MVLGNGKWKGIILDVEKQDSIELLRHIWFVHGGNNIGEIIIIY